MILDMLQSSAFAMGTAIAVALFVAGVLLGDDRPAPNPCEYDGYYARSRDLDVEITELLAAERA